MATSLSNVDWLLTSKRLSSQVSSHDNAFDDNLSAPSLNDSTMQEHAVVHSASDAVDESNETDCENTSRSLVSSDQLATSESMTITTCQMLENKESMGSNVKDSDGNLQNSFDCPRASKFDVAESPYESLTTSVGQVFTAPKDQFNSDAHSDQLPSDSNSKFNHGGNSNVILSPENSKCSHTNTNSDAHYSKSPHSKPSSSTPPSNIHYCNLCGKQYRHGASLRNHMRKHETGILASKKYRCLYCAYSSQYNRNVIKHTETTHRGAYTLHQRVRAVQNTYATSFADSKSPFVHAIGQSGTNSLVTHNFNPYCDLRLETTKTNRQQSATSVRHVLDGTDDLNTLKPMHSSQQRWSLPNYPQREQSCITDRNVSSLYVHADSGNKFQQDLPSKQPNFLKRKSLQELLNPDDTDLFSFGNGSVKRNADEMQNLFDEIAHSVPKKQQFDDRINNSIQRHVTDEYSAKSDVYCFSTACTQALESNFNRIIREESDPETSVSLPTESTISYSNQPNGGLIPHYADYTESFDTKSAVEQLLSMSELPVGSVDGLIHNMPSDDSVKLNNDSSLSICEKPVDATRKRKSDNSELGLTPETEAFFSDLEEILAREVTLLDSSASKQLYTAKPEDDRLKQDASSTRMSPQYANGKLFATTSTLSGDSGLECWSSSSSCSAGANSSVWSTQEPNTNSKSPSTFPLTNNTGLLGLDEQSKKLIAERNYSGKMGGDECIPERLTQMNNFSTRQNSFNLNIPSASNVKLEQPDEKAYEIADSRMYAANMPDGSAQLFNSDFVHCYNPPSRHSMSRALAVEKPLHDVCSRYDSTGMLPQERNHHFVPRLDSNAHSSYRATITSETADPTIPESYRLHGTVPIDMKRYACVQLMPTHLRQRDPGYFVPEPCNPYGAKTSALPMQSDSELSSAGLGFARNHPTYGWMPNGQPSGPMHPVIRYSVPERGYAPAVLQRAGWSTPSYQPAYHPNTHLPQNTYRAYNKPLACDPHYVQPNSADDQGFASGFVRTHPQDPRQFNHPHDGTSESSYTFEEASFGNSALADGYTQIQSTRPLRYHPSFASYNPAENFPANLPVSDFDPSTVPAMQQPPYRGHGINATRFWHNEPSVNSSHVPPRVPVNPDEHVYGYSYVSAGSRVSVAATPMASGNGTPFHTTNDGLGEVDAFLNQQSENSRPRVD